MDEVEAKGCARSHTWRGLPQNSVTTELHKNHSLPHGNFTYKGQEISLDFTSNPKDLKACQPLRETAAGPKFSSGPAPLSLVNKRGISHPQ